MASQNAALKLHKAQAALAALAVHGQASTPFAQAGWIGAFLPEQEHSSLIAIEITGSAGHVVLPLVLRKRWGVMLAIPPGGALANYHAPVLSGTLAALTDAELANILMAGLHEAKADCLLLTDSPFDISGAANPLARLGNQPSPDAAHGLTLQSDSESLFSRHFDKDARKKQRQKARKRAEFGEARAKFLPEGALRKACLEQLLVWKAARFATAGIPDPFAGIDARTALESGLANGSLRLFALFAGERLLAGLIGAMNQGVFSGMLNAHDPVPDIEKTSPGEALLLELVRTLCQEGALRFDLGTGEARYKTGICPEPIPLFDLALAVTPKGRIAARAFLLMRRLKGMIKRSGPAMAIIARLRRLKAKWSGHA